MCPIELTPTQSQAKDITRNIAVTAGAGSGKTEVLTQRLVHIYQQNQHLGIGNVLVLTFTEKAAGEMKDRFRSSLARQLAREDLSDKERAHWRGLQEEFSENHISTIHAFCSAMLRRYPIEADIDPTFCVLEGFDQRELLGESVKTVLSKYARDAKDPHLEVLLDNWRRSQLINILYDMVEKRWELREWVERYSTFEPHRLMKEVISHRDALLGDLLNCKELSTISREFAGYSPDSPGAREDSFARAKIEYMGLLDSLQSPPLPPEHALEIIRLIKKVRKPGKPTKAWSKDGPSLKESIDKLTALLDSYPLEGFSLGKEEVSITILKSLAIVLAGCLDLYQSNKRDNQSLDFEDLQIETANLLTRHPKIRHELAAQFRYIMVDEFQDTNDLQWEIIRQLAADDKLKLLPDKLFIVGDEKQSIYSFRGGDVTTFGRARAELKDKSAEIVFNENFRSNEELIRFTNNLFQQLLSRPGGYKPYEATPQLLQPGQRRDGGTVELLLVDETDNSTLSYRAEARLIADRVRRIADGELSQYRDITQLINQNKKAIAILFRRRTHLKIYEEALREQGLEFIVPGSQGFFQRQEIKDISNILDFLTNPGNSIALAGVLRSPLVGLSDDALYTISRAEGDTLWERTTNISLEETDKAAYERGMKLLRRWLQIRDHLGLSELVRTIMDESGYTATDDPQVRANVEKLISIARKYSKTPWKGLWAFRTFLDEQIVAEEKEETKYTSEGAIQLLTIHHSKGLEFPLVIIPDLSGDFFKGKKSSYYFGEVGESDTIQLGIKAPDPDKDFKYDDTLYRKLLFHQSRKKELAELKRLLYVAATRAQNHLILAGQLRIGAVPKESLDDCKKFMDWLRIILHIESPMTARLSTVDGDITIPITSCVEEKPQPRPQQETSIIPPPQNVVLAQIKKTGTFRLSPTALSSYASCPQCFFFRYILGAPGLSTSYDEDNDMLNNTPPINAALRGLIAHSLFEDEIYRDMDILRHRVLSQIRHSASDETNIDELCEQVYVNLTNYRNSDTYKDTAAEFYNEVSFEVDIDAVRLYGVIDKLYRSETDGLLRVLDFKTNAVADISQAEVEVQKHRYDLQVQCYCLAAEQITGENIKEARLFFSHIPSPDREIIIPFDEDAKRDIQARLNSLTGDIESGSYLPLISPSCDSCTYKFYCGAQKC